MKQTSNYVLAFLFLLVPSSVCISQVSISAIGTAYTENFSSLAAPSATTGTTLPTGWSFSEGLSNANSAYSVNNGSSSTGDTYSYGPATGNTSDRALGGVRSGSLVPTFGASFINNSGSTITQLAISYNGEYWRCGTANRLDRLDFAYSINATSLITGDWNDVDNLDLNNSEFADAITTTGAKDGNTYSKAISYTIQNLNIPVGATFWIRWNDLDASGADDGMAVDDFSITAFNANGSGTESNLFIYDNTNNLVGLGKAPLVNPAIKFDLSGSLRTTGKLYVGVPTTDDGKLINLASSPEYTLAVNGAALVTKLVVKKYINWPDYVFEKSYDLMPLHALSEYINRNKHLPAVPSAAQIEREGIDVGDIQAILLKKIEELTLYVLQQEKELKMQVEELKSLQKKLKNK